MQSSHPYEQPSITEILVLSSFLLLLNVVNKALDSMLYCGLVGQVFVGILFGTPGANLLNDTIETTVSNLGYLGLILLVYEGGLSTSLSSIISSLILSLLVAFTGILLPIALSFLLIPLGASSLQCFTAGASLSATSLGTAFTTLSSSGLLNTHVGTLLTSAAMLDDVIGLVMLQIVTELSTGQRTASDFGKTIGRALGASVGLVLVVVIICRLIIRPLYKPVTSWLRSPKRSRLVKTALGGMYMSLVIHTVLLLSLVVAGNYAGTSTLLAAYIAGAIVRWWGDEVVIPTKEDDRTSNLEHTDSRIPSATSSSLPIGLQVFERFYGSSTQQILKPFFFASIGFSIPITQMFHATTVWKGLVYASLMFLAKAATGLWLIPRTFEPATGPRVSFLVKLFGKRQAEGELKPGPVEDHPTPTTNAEDILPNAETVTELLPISGTDRLHENLTIAEAKVSGADVDFPDKDTANPPTVTTATATTTSTTSKATQTDPNPHPHPHPQNHNQQNHNQQNRNPSPNPNPSPSPNSPSRTSPPSPPERRALRTYSPALLGLAMGARGEIGFLIASVAQTHGIFSSSVPSLASSSIAVQRDDELYLIVVWAIVLCTIVGPVAVGTLVRRIKRLEAQGQR